MKTITDMAMLHKLFSSKVRIELLNTFFHITDWKV